MRHDKSDRPGITGHQRPHFRDEWEDGIAPLDYVRINYQPLPGPPTHPRVVAFIDTCIRHQLAIAMALWLLILGGGLVIWMAW